MHFEESGGTYLEPPHVQLYLCLTLSDTFEHLLEALQQLTLTLVTYAEGTLLLTLRLLRVVQRLPYPSLQAELIYLLVINLDEVWCSEDDEPGCGTAREGDFEEQIRRGGVWRRKGGPWDDGESLQQIRRT